MLEVEVRAMCGTKVGTSVEVEFEVGVMPGSELGVMLEFEVETMSEIDVEYIPLDGIDVVFVIVD